MKNSIVVYVIMTIACCGGLVTSAPQNKCKNEDMKEECVSALFMIGTDSGFPNTTEDMEKVCVYLKEKGKCIDDYLKTCMTPIEKKATKLIVAGIARRVKKLCKSDENKNEFIESANCGNAAIDSIRSCNEEYRGALYGALTAPNNKKLPILCCKFHEFRECVANGFNTVMVDICPREHSMYFEEIFDTFQSDMIDLMCSKFEEGSDTCEALEVPEVEPSYYTESIFKPLKGIIKTVIENEKKN